MLTPRLKCILNYVNADVAADIGTDHAYVAIELIRSGKARHVIAADIRPGPLNIAAANIEKYGMREHIETRLGSGLDVLEKNEADTIIIAGMGGQLICEIIQANKEIAHTAKLILQPMNDQYELRKYLIENGFTISNEDIENEGHRIYNLITAQTGTHAPFEDDIDYHLPPYLYTHPKFHLLLEKKLREFNKIIDGLEKSGSCDINRLKYYKSCRAKAEEIQRSVIK